MRSQYENGVEDKDYEEQYEALQRIAERIIENLNDRKIASAMMYADIFKKQSDRLFFGRILN